jgi:hypothetical protein
MLAAILMYAFLQLILLIPFGLVVWGAMFLVRRRPRYGRAATFVFCVTLLCTPAWGPTTITMAPVPFGLIFGVAAATFRWRVLLDTMAMAPPLWYLVAFPATAIAACAFWVFSNRSSKRRRDKPRAA